MAALGRADAAQALFILQLLQVALNGTGGHADLRGQLGNGDLRVLPHRIQYLPDVFPDVFSKSLPCMRGAALAVADQPVSAPMLDPSYGHHSKPNPESYRPMNSSACAGLTIEIPLKPPNSSKCRSPVTIRSARGRYCAGDDMIVVGVTGYHSGNMGRHEQICEGLVLCHQYRHVGFVLSHALRELWVAQRAGRSSISTVLLQSSKRRSIA